MTQRTVLALDQSVKSCGWALWSTDGTVQSGAWVLADGIASRATAFVAIHIKLQLLHDEHGLTDIFVEAPILTKRDKVAKLIALYGLVASVEAWAKSRGVKVHPPVDQRSWRTTYLGKGYNTDRDSEDVKRFAIERSREFGFDPITNDQAEAQGILDHGLQLLKIVPPWREDQTQLSLV